MWITAHVGVSIGFSSLIIFNPPLTHIACSSLVAKLSALLLSSKVIERLQPCSVLCKGADGAVAIANPPLYVCIFYLFLVT
ncbi:hypothetical protein GGR58DRAFT_456404 [Xylaria digitata]|nr:hypothetical protein GGR58DRAFT_456404 [Xylaria digitata]